MMLTTATSTTNRTTTPHMPLVSNAPFTRRCAPLGGALPSAAACCAALSVLATWSRARREGGCFVEGARCNMGI